jgi:acyl-CoA reductase-like NAD-dependent aldehyde dehydrogenase
VAAITPFNFPLNLVAHKVGPALAAGNAVLLKPASDTPLSALKLVEILLEAGLPPLAIACLTGPGHELGQAICTHPLVRKISFTGSHEIGEAICRMAGVKRVTMELGSNSPVIVLPDADLEQAAKLVTASGYSNAGQVCISAQRVLVIRSVYQDFLDALAPRVESLRTGDPLDPATQMGPMVREADARRVEAWIGEAVAGGARVVEPCTSPPCWPMSPRPSGSLARNSSARRSRSRLWPIFPRRSNWRMRRDTGSPPACSPATSRRPCASCGKSNRATCTSTGGLSGGPT